jgi:hypothetical protein
MKQLMELRFVDRQCVVARLHEFCWGKELAKAKAAELRGPLETAAADIHRFTIYACRDTREGKRKPEDIQKAVMRVWDIVFKEKKR